MSDRNDMWDAARQYVSIHRGMLDRGELDQLSVGKRMKKVTDMQKSVLTSFGFDRDMNTLRKMMECVAHLRRKDMSAYDDEVLVPPAPGMVLTADAQEEYEDWEVNYKDEPCICSAVSHPPCHVCEGGGTHPGNPLALNDDPDAWETSEEAEAGAAADAYERAMGIIGD